MYGMFIHHGLSLTMLERKGIIKIHLVNILQTSTEINDVQISKELFIVTILFGKYYEKVGQKLRDINDCTLSPVLTKVIQILMDQIKDI